MSGKKIGEDVSILSIKKTKKGVDLVLSNGEKFKLSENSATEFPLYVGKTLSPEELSSLRSFEKEDEYMEEALKMLAKDNRTCYEVKEKLIAKGAAPSLAKKVVARLCKEGLLDDQSYAKTYADDVADLRMLGEKKILFELKKKGIGEDVLSSLAFPREKELEKAKRASETLDKRYSRLSNGAKKQKIVAALIQRGFEKSIAEEAASTMMVVQDDEAEQEKLSRDFEILLAKYQRKYEGRDLDDHIFRGLLAKGYDFDDVKAIVEKRKHEVEE